VRSAILPSTEDITLVLSTKIHGVPSRGAAFSYSCPTLIILREAGKNYIIGRLIKRTVVAVVIQSRCDGRAFGSHGKLEKCMQNFDTETRKDRQLGRLTHCQEGNIKMALSEVV
jgi:hypothetical protein